MSHLHFPGRARGQLNRTTCSTVHCTLGAALLVLATACGESTAPVAALHPAMGVASGLITVAPAGLATAAGTLRSPMTLEQAMATAQAGATIQLMSGTYQTGDLVVTRPITIRPAPGATVKLTGSVAIAAGEWQAAGSAWRTPWSAQGVPSKAAATPSAGAASASSTTASVAAPRTTASAAQAVSDERTILLQSLGGASEYAAHQHMAYFDGKALTRVSSLGEVAPGKFYVDTVAKWLYVGQNPGGHMVEASAAAVGMLLYTSNIRVTGISLQHFSQIGLRIQGSNVQVDHNTLSYNGLDGLMVNAAPSALVQDNVVRYNGQAGIVANSARGVIVEDNDISNNNTANYDLSLYAAGIKATQMTNMIIKGNWIADNASNALWMDVSSVNTTIVANQVLRSAAYGIYIELGSGVIIAGNIVHDNRNGIGVHFTQNASLYNNTLLNNGEDLDVSAWKSDPSSDLTHAVIVNNLIWNSTLGVMVNLYRAEGCNSTVYSEVDYNGYYRPSGSVAKTVVNWCNDFYPTMAAFHKGTGYEAHGFEVDGGGDPFFMSAWTENYHLHSGSKAIGSGQPLPANIANALGWPAGKAVSLGALQH